MDLAAAIDHAEAREAILAALALPADIGKRMIQYISLFRPPKRQLSLARVAKILQELQVDIDRAQIERDGRAWPAPQKAWVEALDQMLAGRDRLTLPLSGHGYLYELLKAKANKAEARNEEYNIARQRSAPIPAGATAVEHKRDFVTAGKAIAELQAVLATRKRPGDPS